MANKPLRPCRHAGCHALVPDGYCTKHKPKDNRGADSRAWHRLYRTREWREDLRPTQLLREPFCRECTKQGYRTPATDVDHVTPHCGDWALFSDRRNLQSLCHACHSRKTLAEMQKNKRKK